MLAQVAGLTNLRAAGAPGTDRGRFAMTARAAGPGDIPPMQNRPIGVDVEQQE
jgi:hypothetical protein